MSRVEPPAATADAPDAAPPGGRARVRLRPPDPGDRAALRLWLLTRVPVLLVTGSAGWVLAGPGATRPVPFLKTFDQWDFRHFATIGRFGYTGDPAGGPTVPLEAFFPGYPLLLRAAHAVLGNWAVSGMALSFTCGAAAVVLLSRTARLDHAPEVGERAVLLLLLSPPAVFLAAGYTEPVFLLLALSSWLCARRGDWAAAGLLAAGATATRVNGLFLVCALVVQYAAGPRAPGTRRRARDLAWLAAGAVPALAFTCYLYRRTGDWTAWDTAQAAGWDRHVVGPLEALQGTWHQAFTHGPGTLPGVGWEDLWEMAAVAVGLALTGWLLSRRRWAEAVYTGLTVVPLALSTTYLSVPRATLLWWPLWIALGELTLRRRGAFTAYLVLVAPFSVVFALLFGAGRWAG